jgi:hypothetical protein
MYVHSPVVHELRLTNIMQDYQAPVAQAKTMPDNNAQDNENGADTYECAAEAFEQQQAQQERQQSPPPRKDSPSESEKNEHWFNK